MKVAVLGLGFMGATHLKALKALPDVTVAAVCSDDPRPLSGDLSFIQGNIGGPGERFDFSNVKTYPNVEPIIADPEIEAVDICLPSHMHAAVAIEALRAGKHVLVEKPMALDGPAADGMIEAAERAGKILMAAHVLRFMPPYVGLRGVMAGGALGLVRSALFRRRCSAPFWSTWLADPGKSGGGVFDLLIHDIDMAIHLFGLPDSVEASGYENLGKGIDIMHAELFYSHGGSVLITGGWHHPKSYPFSMEYTVVCDGGTVDFSSEGRPPALYRDNGEMEKLNLPDVDGYAAELKYFVECCREGVRPTVCPAAESAAAVKLARLILEARNKNGERLSCDISSLSKSA
jgi:predicted dehydrogenase